MLFGLVKFYQATDILNLFFLAVNGRFNCVTSYVKVLGWLEKKEEEKRETILDFDHSW